MNANDLTFGIEIETTIPAGRIPVGSYRVGTQVADLPPGWRAKYDGSIAAGRGRQGCEFVSPILQGAAGIRQVIEVVEKLKQLGAKVNASTGVHVHVGWNGTAKALARLVTLVANFEKAIFASTGTKRRETGDWCRGLQRHGSCDRAAVQSQQNRYHVLNLSNLATGRTQTVEFRAFAGSLNALKLVSYIRLCVGLVERAHKVARATNFTAKKPVATSPIHRNGEGQTELTRLFYQLGWTKGRVSHTHGDLTCDRAPTIKQSKKELMRLAKKYDAQP